MFINIDKRKKCFILELKGKKIMLERRYNNKLREAINVLNQFDNENLIYWIKAYKKHYKLCIADEGFLINYFKLN